MTSRFRIVVAALVILVPLGPQFGFASSPEDPPPAQPTQDYANAVRAGRSYARPSNYSGSDRYSRSNGRYSDRTRIASTRSAAPPEELYSPPPRTEERWRGEMNPSTAFDTNGSYDSFDAGYDDGSGYGNGGGGCGPSGCGLSRCGPIYARGEYLLWWLKGDSTPPLVTTSPAGTPRAQAGVLGQPDTTVLFGGDRINDTGRSGARVVVGTWIGQCARLEGEWFGLGNNNASFNQFSTGNLILARPFFNLTTGAQDANVVTFPGQLQGTLNVSTSSSFQGAGLRATQNLCFGDYCDRNYRIDFLYGFRYLRLRENIAVTDSITSVGNSAAVGTLFSTSDSFQTSNNFYGADLGLMAEGRLRRWCLTSIGHVGLGGTAERVSINGSTNVTPVGGQTATTPGGLLAMPSNIGNYSRNAFAVVPHWELKLAYDLTCNVRFTCGYDVIYWSRVARPGEQIDTFVNTSQAGGRPLTGTPGPLFAFHESDLWIQGFSIGGEWRF